VAPAVDAPSGFPEDAGLAPGALLTDTGQLSEAIRRFLTEVEAGGRELTRGLVDNPWITCVITVGLAALAAESARRRVIRSGCTGDADPQDEPELGGLSGSSPFPSSSF
jgi:hypothetical protein